MSEVEKDIDDLEMGIAKEIEEVSSEVEHVDEVKEVVEEPEMDPIEAEARAKGWKPPEEFNDPDKEAIGAAEFLRNGSFFKKIEELGGHIKRLEKQVRNERKRGYEQAINEIIAKRKEAVEIGDLDAFDAFDSEYNRLKEELYADSHEPEVEVTGPSEHVVNFLERNQSWFNESSPSNREMRDQAIQVEQALMTSKPYLTEKQRLDLVESEIKTLYKDRFINTKKQLQPKVETPDVRAKPTKDAVRLEDLNDAQRATLQEILSAEPDKRPEDFLHIFNK